MKFRKIDIVISAGLILMVAAVFGQTARFDFINYDDNVYVTQNPLIIRGISWRSVKWAFTQPHAKNWHPLTTLSHMLDCQWFGLDAGRQHLVNVALHALAAVLLFLALGKLTGARGPSAFVAAIFAIHPAHVESVAWISERKDVLSGLFFALSLGAYCYYARSQTVARYLLLLLVYAAGLMSKPMLVSTPFVLFFLDYWPLRRVRDLRTAALAALEKLPLLVLAAAVGVVTYILQLGTVGAVPPLPLSMRITNALYSYYVYLAQFFSPDQLAAFYPHPDGHLTAVQIGAGATILLAMLLGGILLRQRRGYLLTGFGWFVIMLLPVIGVVEVGLQGHADRYTYLPYIGLAIAVTWLVVDLTRTWKYQRGILAVAAVLCVGSLAVGAYIQTGVWQNSETLWRHALAVTTDNDVAHANLGRALIARGDGDRAIDEYRKALAVHEQDTDPHYALGRAIVHSSIGEVLAAKDQISEAVTEFREAIKQESNYPQAHYNLGVVLASVGDVDGSIAEWRAALVIQPDDAEARAHLGTALLQKHEIAQAVEEYERAIGATVPSMMAFNNLAWVFATSPNESRRNPAGAMQLAQDAVIASQGRDPNLLRTLAAAAAASGDFDAAIATAERALQRAANDPYLSRNISGDLELYRQHIPLRDQALAE